MIFIPGRAPHYSVHVPVPCIMILITCTCVIHAKSYWIVSPPVTCFKLNLERHKANYLVTHIHAHTSSYNVHDINWGAREAWSSSPQLMPCNWFVGSWPPFIFGQLYDDPPPSRSRQKLWLLGNYQQTHTQLCTKHPSPCGCQAVRGSQGQHGHCKLRNTSTKGELEERRERGREREGERERERNILDWICVQINKLVYASISEWACTYL